MHAFHPFPKWKYHAEKEARIVPHAEAEEALGSEWVDSPAHVVKPEKPVKAEKPEAEAAPVTPGLKRALRKEKG